MTEAEWLACTDPRPMLELLRASGTAGARKLRLFACACCRRMAPLLGDERRRRPVEVAERFADGLASAAEMEAAACPVPVAVGWVTDGDAGRAAAGAADAVAFALAAQPTGSPLRREWAAERAAQAGLLRCLFARPPFRPVTIPAPVLAWDGGVARRVAEAIYESRRFEDLPLLAALLEAAGCTDAALLAHLRGPGPHAKGCHALDAVLGKS
jgi:hypothetical protein